MGNVFKFVGEKKTQKKKEEMPCNMKSILQKSTFVPYLAYAVLRKGDKPVVSGHGLQLRTCCDVSGLQGRPNEHGGNRPIGNIGSLGPTQPLKTSVRVVGLLSVITDLN